MYNIYDIPFFVLVIKMVLILNKNIIILYTFYIRIYIEKLKNTFTKLTAFSPPMEQMFFSALP